MTTYADYTLVSRTYASRIEWLEKEQYIQREAAYFRANIGKITSGEELIADYRLYNFAMKAFGLGSELYAKGIMKKVFAEGVVDKTAMANKLVDSKYREIATAFGFAEAGNLKMSVARNVESVVEKYLTQELEERVGEDNQGVRLALYFERVAPNLDNWYEVLGDTALAQVARTAFGLPEEFAQTNIDRQAAYFESRMKIEDFKDPARLKTFMQRFTALWDVTQDPAGGVDLAANGIAPIQPLSASGPQLVSIDPALLADLSRYKI